MVFSCFLKKEKVIVCKFLFLQMVIIQINKVGLPFEPNVKMQLQNPMQKHVQIVIWVKTHAKEPQRALDVFEIGCLIPS
jgi:hypothetical protein